MNERELESIAAKLGTLPGPVIKTILRGVEANAAIAAAHSLAAQLTAIRNQHTGAFHPDKLEAAVRAWLEQYGAELPESRERDYQPDRRRRPSRREFRPDERRTWERQDEFHGRLPERPERTGDRDRKPVTEQKGTCSFCKTEILKFGNSQWTHTDDEYEDHDPVPAVTG